MSRVEREDIIEAQQRLGFTATECSVRQEFSFGLSKKDVY